MCTRTRTRDAHEHVYEDMDDPGSTRSPRSATSRTFRLALKASSAPRPSGTSLCC